MNKVLSIFVLIGTLCLLSCSTGTSVNCDGYQQRIDSLQAIIDASPPNFIDILNSPPWTEFSGVKMFVLSNLPDNVLIVSSGLTVEMIEVLTDSTMQALWMVTPDPVWVAPSDFRFHNQ